MKKHIPSTNNIDNIIMDYKLCRICTESNGISNIFDNKDGIILCKKIMFCCPNVIIEEGDGLPSHICIYCEKELASVYKFILKCEFADRNFRSQTSPNIIQPYNDEESFTKVEVKAEENAGTDNDLSFSNESYDEFDIPLSSIGKTVKASIINNTDVAFKKRKLKCRKTSKHKNSTSNKCSICGRKCQNPSTLMSHMRSHTTEKPYQCSVCDKTYKDPGSLKRHADRNHTKKRERKFICETCGKGFYSKTDVVTHMRSHTGETPFACSECPSSFTQLSSLIRHRIKHTGEKLHVCPTCSKRFSTKDQLNAHLRVHSEIKKEFSCTICSVLFKYKNNLKKHMKRHTEPSRFVCNYCGRTFNLKGNLKIHIDRVHSEKSGFCNTCSKIVSNIEMHMWRHTGQRPLKCEHCTSSFYELKALAHHMNFRHKHTDKYKCAYESCFRTFPSQPMLDFHVAKHHESNIKFPCDKCSRGFYRKNDLARHKIGTHKEKLL